VNPSYQQLKDLHVAVMARWKKEHVAATSPSKKEGKKGGNKKPTLSLPFIPSQPSTPKSGSSNTSTTTSTTTTTTTTITTIGGRGAFLLQSLFQWQSTQETDTPLALPEFFGLSQRKILNVPTRAAAIQVDGSTRYFISTTAFEKAFMKVFRRLRSSSSIEIVEGGSGGPPPPTTTTTQEMSEDSTSSCISLDNDTNTPTTTSTTTTSPNEGGESPTKTRIRLSLNGGGSDDDDDDDDDDDEQDNLPPEMMPHDTPPGSEDESRAKSNTSTTTTTTTTTLSTTKTKYIRESLHKVLDVFTYEKQNVLDLQQVLCVLVVLSDIHVVQKIELCFEILRESPRKDSINRANVLLLMQNAIEVTKKDFSRSTLDSLVNSSTLLQLDRLNYSQFCTVISGNLKVQDALWEKVEEDTTTTVVVSPSSATTSTTPVCSTTATPTTVTTFTTTIIPEPPLSPVPHNNIVVQGEGQKEGDTTNNKDTGTTTSGVDLKLL